MVRALDKKKVRNEYELLFLNYHRNKNQHRSATWFKYLNLLVRHLRKLLLSKSVKYQKKSIAYLNNHIIPKLYYAFNGVIAQGQFITLGFSLVGSLSKIYGLLCDLEEKSSATSIQSLLQLPIDAEQDIGEEIEISSDGLIKESAFKAEQIVVLKEKDKSLTSKKRVSSSIDEIFGPDKKKKKTKKKKKSLIDDIFG